MSDTAEQPPLFEEPSQDDGKVIDMDEWSKRVAEGGRERGPGKPPSEAAEDQGWGNSTIEQSQAGHPTSNPITKVVIPNDKEAGRDEDWRLGEDAKVTSINGLAEARKASDEVRKKK